MRLALKLALLLALASAGPLVLTSAVTVPRSTAELRAQLDGLYQANADALAEEFTGAIQERAGGLQLYATAIDFSQLADDEQVLQAALRLIYRQTRNAGAVALVDAAGVPVTDPVRLARPRDQGFADQEGSDEALASFGANLPYREALKLDRVVIGPHYSVPDEAGRPMPRIAVAVPARSPEGARWVLAAELSLRPVVERLDRFRLGATGGATLIDGEGAVIHSGRPPQEGELLGAGARLGNVPWTLRVEQSAEEALAPVRRQYRDALIWAAVGLIIALGLAFTAVRSVTRPMGVLEEAAAQVERGDLEATVTIRGKDEIARLGAAFNTMVRGLRERERLKKSFSRYVSGPVAERILRETNDLDLQGEQAVCTIVFMDIRGFTPLAEQLPPRAVVDLLNSYFQRVVEVVMRHEGVVMKFIGDAVMVMFGVPGAIPNPELRAVQAAMEIQEVVGAFNLEREAQGRTVARFGIGINTGPAVVGNVGSEERMEYTAIGDAVNLAERLQGLAAGGEVVISAATRARVEDRFTFETRGRVQVKGKVEPVEVFRVAAVVRGGASVAEG